GRCCGKCGMSLLGVFGEAPHEEVTKRWGGFGRKRIPIRLAAYDRRQGVCEGFTGEGLLSGEHLIEHATERPDVRALVDRFPLRLLRAHVSSRPEDHTGLSAFKQCRGMR